MSAVKHAVISAAGFGSRLGMNMPKCLVTINGRSLIDYQLELLASVPHILIVVGFMEEQVMDHARRLRPDAVFVRNPQFHATSNAHSVWLASHQLREPFLIVDGDLLIRKTDFSAFLGSCQNGQPQIGVTASKSEEAVYARLGDDDKIDAFSYTETSPWEWCGVALVPPGIIQSNKRYVFEELKKILPARSAKLDVYEIDTQQDLNMAIRKAGQLGYDDRK